MNLTILSTFAFSDSFRNKVAPTSNVSAVHFKPSSEDSKMEISQQIISNQKKFWFLFWGILQTILWNYLRGLLLKMSVRSPSKPCANFLKSLPKNDRYISTRNPQGTPSRSFTDFFTKIRKIFENLGWHLNSTTSLTVDRSDWWPIDGK